MYIEEILIKLQMRLDNIQELLELAIGTLTNKQAVSKFLHKNPKTIDTYIKNGSYIENVHFFLNDRGKVEFLPFGILNFRKKPNYKIVFSEEKEILDSKDLHLNKTTNKILKGIL
ncbi:MAG: hypothetical protein HRT40_13565 [Campylobacteraceae bacterium]|nr:hypothetical protein [Campylobacteraceae bacterium]